MPCSQALLSGEPRLSLNLADITWAGKHRGNILDAKCKVVAILVFSREGAYGKDMCMVIAPFKI